MSKNKSFLAMWTIILIITSQAFTISCSSNDSDKSTNQNQNKKDSFSHEQIFNAARKGNIKAIESFDKKHDLRSYLSSKDLDGNTFLHVAYLNEQTDFVVHFIKENSLSVKWLATDLRDSRGHSVFDLAAINGDVTILKSIEHNYHSHKLPTNDKGETPLHLAATYGQNEFVSELLKSEKFHNIVNTKDLSGLNPAHKALFSNHKNVLKALVSDESFDINNLDENGKTLLHHAIEIRRHEFARILLLNKKIDLNIANSDGQTALSMAVANENLPLTLDLLSEDTIDPNVQNNEGKTALHIATIRGNKKLVSTLLLNEKVDSSIQNNNKNTALYLAAYAKNSELVSTLVSNNNPGYNELSRAIYTNNEAVFTELLKTNKIDINYQGHSSKNTALHLIIYNNRKNMLKELLKDEDININLINTKGETPLSTLRVSIFDENPERLEILDTLLNDKRLDPNIKNEEGKTYLEALSTSVTYDSNKLLFINRLLKHPKINVNLYDEQGYTLLHRLLDYSSNQPDKKNSIAKVIELLLKHDDVKPNRLNKRGLPLLHEAIFLGNVEHIKVLLANDKVDITTKSDYGLSILADMKTHQDNYDEIILLLINHNQMTFAEFSSSMANRFEVLHLGSKLFNENKRVIQYKKILESIRATVKNQSPEELFSLLKKYEVDPTVVSKKRFGLLHLAIEEANLDTIVALLNLDSFNANALADTRFVAPLHLASAIYNNPDTLQLLLDHDKVENNLATENGSTALHFAVKSGDNIENIFTLLEQENFDVNVQNKYGLTALHIAVVQEKEQYVELLLSHYKIDRTLKAKGKTALQIAQSRGFKKIIELFEQY